jgi:DNA-binding transcriptional ArsR family regulator
MDNDDKRFERRAAIAAAMAHPLRLKVLEHLHVHGATCVCQLVEVFGCKQPIMSKHLLILKNAGLVSLKKEGLKAFYSLKTPCILSFFACADKTFENHKNSM